MKKKLLMFGLLSVIQIATAGEATVDVPVTINYTGGCVINAPASINLGTFSTRDGNVPLSNITFAVRCTAGTQYTVKYVSGDRLDLQGTNNWVRFLVYKDAGRTDRVLPNSDITTATGTGQDQQVVLYTTKGHYEGANLMKGCGSGYYSAETCSPGSYSGTIQVKVIW